MTREKAILVLKAEWRSKETDFSDNVVREALEMAIKALEAEPCEDAISRQAVYLAINERAKESSLKGRVALLNFKRAIIELPSVTPNQAESCEDCVSRHTVFEVINKIEEPNDERGGFFIDNTDELVFAVRDLPSVTPARPKGKWIEDDEHNQNHIEKIWHCSECNYEAWGEYDKSDFCGGCGADMRGEEDADS